MPENQGSILDLKAGAADAPKTAPAAKSPPVDPPTPPVAAKEQPKSDEKKNLGTVRRLEAEYQSSIIDLKAAIKKSGELERELMVEVKAKLKAHAGDVEAFQAKKHAAFLALRKAMDLPAETPADPMIANSKATGLIAAGASK